MWCAFSCLLPSLACTSCSSLPRFIAPHSTSRPSLRRLLVTASRCVLPFSGAFHVGPHFSKASPSPAEIREPLDYFCYYYYRIWLASPHTPTLSRSIIDSHHVEAVAAGTADEHLRPCQCCCETPYVERWRVAQGFRGSPVLPARRCALAEQVCHASMEVRRDSYPAPPCTRMRSSSTHARLQLTRSCRMACACRWSRTSA